MNCPNCGFQQPIGPECLNCGIIFEKYQGTAQPAGERMSLPSSPNASPIERPVQQPPTNTEPRSQQNPRKGTFGAVQASREERWSASIGQTAVISRALASVGALAIAGLMLTGGSALSGFLPYLLMLFYIGGGMWGLLSIRNRISVKQFGVEICLLVVISVTVRLLYPQIFQVDYQENVTEETAGLNPYRGFINHTESFQKNIAYFIEPRKARPTTIGCTDENPILEATGRMHCCFKTQNDYCIQHEKTDTEGNVTEEGVYLEYPTKKQVDALFKKVRKEYEGFKANDIDRALAAGEVWQKSKRIYQLFLNHLIERRGVQALEGSTVHLLSETAPKEDLQAHMKELTSMLESLHRRGANP